MNQALLFSWFPILLGVGVGGRLLGQSRGFGLGALAALFWIVLVQAEGGIGIWHEPWQVGALAAGAFVLVMMGGWSGQSDVHRPVIALKANPGAESGSAFQKDNTAKWQKISSVAEQFDDWLTRHASERNPWPKFSEFVRSVLYECCQATHVKCFRFLKNTQELQCLDASDDLIEPSRTPAADGVIGRVLSSGQSFVMGEESSPSSEVPAAEGSGTSKVSALLDFNQRGPCWCFAIERGGKRVGVVSVGQLGAERPLRGHMAAVEKLVGVFWLHLMEVNINRLAGDEDAVSGLLNRPTFLRSADAALRESYEQGEPVALAVVGVQGLRQLNDSGRWEVADELIQEIGVTLQARARMDDRIGRFDGSRFIWLLRRVDGELASLILKHVMGRLEQVCGNGRWGVPVLAYCGLTGSGKAKFDLRRLVSSALQQSQRARIEGLSLASDLAVEREALDQALVGAEA